MMKQLLIACVFIIPLSCFAQKEELKKWCNEVDKNFKSAKPFYVQYTLTVTGRSEQPGKESMLVDYYKSGNMFKCYMGDAQDLVQDSKVLVIANHVDKTMTVQSVNKGASPDQSLLSYLPQLVDSAMNVSRKQDQAYTTYRLNFNPEYLYSEIRLTFHSKTHEIAAMYAEFNPLYSEPYFSMDVVYKKWNYAWKPEAGFPAVSNYVKKNGEHYAAVDKWASYRFYQSGKIN